MVRERRKIPNNQGLFQRKLNLFQLKVLVLQIHINCCLIYAKKSFFCTFKHKGLVALCHSFCIFLFLFTLHTFIQSFIHNIRWGQSPYLHSCELSRLNLHGVPSWDSNSDLPYSKPVHQYHLSYAAPFKKYIYCIHEVEREGDREESGWKRENAVE